MTYQEQLEMLLLECTEKWRAYANVVSAAGQSVSYADGLRRELDKAEHAYSRCLYLMSTRKVNPQEPVAAHHSEAW